MNTGRDNKSLDEQVKTRLLQISSLRTERRKKFQNEKRVIDLGENNPIKSPRPIEQLLLSLNEGIKNENQELKIQVLKELCYLTRNWKNDTITVDKIMDVTMTLRPLLQQTNLTFPEIKYSIHIFTNISALSEGLLNPLITGGILTIMGYYLKDSNSEIVSMVLSFFSNLIIESKELTTIVFQMGFIEIMTGINQQPMTSVALQNSYAWCFCNICRSVSKQYNIDFIRNIIPIQLLEKESSESAIADSCWGIYTISRNLQQFNLLVDSHVFELLFKLLRKKNTLIITPILKILEAYSYEDERYFNHFIKHDIFSYIKSIIASPQTKDSILKQCTFIASNLVVSESFKKLLINNGIVPMLIQKYIVLSDESKNNIKWMLINILVMADDQEVFFLCQMDQLFYIFADFDNRDDRLVQLYLSSLIKICCVGASLAQTGENVYVEKLVEAGTKRCVEVYINHHDPETSKMAAVVLRFFLDTESESSLDMESAY
ncbi:importin subunit alpha-2, putative [Entamoeba dispar SAW760]|uniref:Importin subunit alpha-2, putative n=1 Tax=Entamoeba dispar (strain ATCC PRA-260 / SAW760) TaxID=370354 RepID=B0EEN7_ENTDS|nr:importin subunit alpha-2, putative [Entamoeba dispar SAW760]EDR27013.1 importin subunit alpha-2, putative [Entamoeba dispar SAW760]|eukprot:EDR27013.1 importin subunit alpha-2, putative [Entamoeba dispar SAW760]